MTNNIKGAIVTVFQHQMLDTWQNVVREMPMGMTKSVNTMAVNEKVIYIYTCFMEWP